MCLRTTDAPVVTVWRISRPLSYCTVIVKAKLLREWGVVFTLVKAAIIIVATDGANRVKNKTIQIVFMTKV